MDGFRAPPHRHADPGQRAGRSNRPNPFQYVVEAQCDLSLLDSMVLRLPSGSGRVAKRTEGGYPLAIDAPEVLRGEIRTGN